jgi:hypothetical protein
MGENGSSFLRKLAELKEPQGWVHHAADAATGQLLTTQLDRPATPRLRAERLSRFGHQFHPPIFPPPTHRLTPRDPYQASPQGSLTFQLANVVSSFFGDWPIGVASWDMREIVPPGIGRMDALLLDAPAGRTPCLLTLMLFGGSLPGQVGHIRIEVRGQLIENAPLIASFDIPVQGDFQHLFDLVFVSAPTVPPTRTVAMIAEPAGLSGVGFTSLTFGFADLVNE